MSNVLLVAFVALAIIGILAILFEIGRRRQLLKKYGDKEIVDMMLKKRIWQGMSVSQLIDTLGYPSEIEHRVSKTRNIEIYKYSPVTRRQYATRITVEGGIVTGWTIK